MGVSHTQVIATKQKREDGIKGIYGIKIGIV